MASQWDSMTLSERVSRAQYVVLGRVESCESQWLGRYIHRACVFQVQEALHGEGPSKLTVQTFGGSAGDFTMVVVGAPVLPPATDLLLFLRQNPDGRTWHVVGLGSGEYETVGDLLLQTPGGQVSTHADMDSSQWHSLGALRTWLQVVSGP